MSGWRRRAIAAVMVAASVLLVAISARSGILQWQVRPFTRASNSLGVEAQRSTTTAAVVSTGTNSSTLIPAAERDRDGGLRLGPAGPTTVTVSSAPPVTVAASALKGESGTGSGGYNVSACVSPLCHRRGDVQPFCVVEQEIECLEWMTTKSDCDQDGLPVPLSPLHDPATGVVRYHMYWTGPLTRVALLSIKSFLVTQPAAQTRLTLWTHAPGANVSDPRDLVAILLGGGRPATGAHSGSSEGTTSPATATPQIRDDPDGAWALLTGDSDGSRRVEVRAFRLDDEWEAIRGDFADGLPGDLQLPAASGPAVGFSDVVRLLVLYRYGGVYVDLDTLFIRDLSPLLHVAPFAYSWGCEDDLVNTAVFALGARSPAATALLSAALDRVRLLAPYYRRQHRTFTLSQGVPS
jgi:hypothetical protein